MIEDKSLNLDRIFDEAIVIRDILRNGYQQILVYEKDIQEIMEDLRASPSDEASKTLYNAERVIALRSRANLEFEKLDPLIKEWINFILIKNSRACITSLLISKCLVKYYKEKAILLVIFKL